MPSLPATFTPAMQHAFGMTRAEVVALPAGLRLEFMELLRQAGYPVAGSRREPSSGQAPIPLTLEDLDL